MESYFDILKESTFERKTNLRPAQVTVSLYRTIQIQLKADKFGVSQNVKNRKGKPKDMNVEEPWGMKRAQKKQRSTYLNRLDKYHQKRLLSKPITPKSKNNFTDNTSSISSNFQDKTIHAVTDISDANLSHTLLKFSSLKCVPLFMEGNPLKDLPFLRNSQTMSVSDIVISPVNIFSSIKLDSLPNALSTPKQAKNMLKGENIEKENLEGQHEDLKTQIKNDISLNFSYYL